MVALGEPAEPLEVGRHRLGREDVLDTGGFVVAQLAERPERVAHRAGGDEQHLAVGGGDRIPERAAEPQVVLGVRGLAHPDGDPALVRQSGAEVLPQVGGRVEDREVLVVDRRDPGSVRVGLGRDRVRQLGIAREVVRPAAHPARQLLGGEEPGTPVVSRDDELHRGGPVGVQDDDGVVVERLEDVPAQLLEPADQRAVLPVVELPPGRLRQCDGRHVREESGADDLTHPSHRQRRARSSPRVRRRCSSRRSRSRTTRCRPRGRCPSDRCRRRVRRGRGRRSS